MTDIFSRLETFHDIMYCTHELYSWQLNIDHSLYYTNCPDKDFYYGLFSVSTCAPAMKEHFENADSPIILNDTLGFVWIAGCQKHNKIPVFYHIIGPLFTVEASESYIVNRCGKMSLSAELANQLLYKIRHVPIVSLNRTIDYAVMLHYCITGTKTGRNDIVMQDRIMDKHENSEWFDTNWHGTWEIEKQLFNSIMNGVPLPDTYNQNRGNVGSMSPGNPLRQAQNEFIVLTVICSRAAMLGGVSPEGAYNLSDYYIQLSEACTNPGAVYNLMLEMSNAYLHRVQLCKKNQEYSSSVASCLEYIETHILEKIQMKDIAETLGYTPYYLSNLFQKETGISIKDYINQRKVEMAKDLLCIPHMTSTVVSERLHFSSPNYFSAIFRKYTGESPSEYKGKNPLMK